VKRAVLLTGHFPHQKRRPSLLWVSQAMQADGWHVTHTTVGYSWLSALRGDRRLAALEHIPKPGTQVISPTLTAIYGLSPLHPFSTRSDLLDTLLRPLHALFPAYWSRPLRAPLAQADLVLIESGAPVMLAPLARNLAPRARLIYRVNDDMRLLGLPAFLPLLESENAQLFDRISTASPHLARRFNHPMVTLDPMGIPQKRLKNIPPDPYGNRTFKEAVCAGTTQLDMAALIRIAQARPSWRLHIIGRLKSTIPTRPDLPNLIFHGEQDFDTTLAHIAHADIGLAPYLDAPGVEYQTTNSNRILLYRHFGLPILGPDRLCHPSFPSIIGYSDPEAWFRCETSPRRPEKIPDWGDLARRLTAQNGLTEPPLDVASVPASA
jgi:2-beta-glucuronyltransferase